MLLQGLGLDCHYSLGSVGIWSETSGIENIPLDYQISIKTSETISYYKYALSILIFTTCFIYILMNICSVILLFFFFLESTSQ